MKTTNQRGALQIAIISFIIGASIFSGVFLWWKKFITKNLPPSSRVCTQEVKLCPDGKLYVSRTGPNCEFQNCPGISASPTPKISPRPTYSILPTPTPVPEKQSCNGPTDKSCSSGYQCIQSCGPPVASEGEPPAPYYCELNEITKKPRICPICLASNTEISSPAGNINVKDITVGTRVWSLNKYGQKIASIVIKISKSYVPKSHKVVHLILADQREVWVSPNHPDINGSPIANLRVGEFYDESKIILNEIVPYWDDATYDILPNSDTGFYWANGILLSSTLAP